MRCLSGLAPWRCSRLRPSRRSRACPPQQRSGQRSSNRYPPPCRAGRRLSRDAGRAGRASGSPAGPAASPVPGRRSIAPRSGAAGRERGLEQGPTGSLASRTGDLLTMVTMRVRILDPRLPARSSRRSAARPVHGAGRCLRRHGLAQALGIGAGGIAFRPRHPLVVALGTSAHARAATATRASAPRIFRRRASGSGRRGAGRASWRSLRWVSGRGNDLAGRAPSRPARRWVLTCRRSSRRRPGLGGASGRRRGTGDVGHHDRAQQHGERGGDGLVQAAVVAAAQRQVGEAGHAVEAGRPDRTPPPGPARLVPDGGPDRLGSARRRCPRRSPAPVPAPACSG